MRVVYEFDIGEEVCLFEYKDELKFCDFFVCSKFYCRLFQTKISIGTSTDAEIPRCRECLNRFPPLSGRQFRDGIMQKQLQ